MEKQRGRPRKNQDIIPNNLYRVSLKLLEGEEYSGSGETIYEAAQNIPFTIKPGRKAILKAQNGDKKAEMLLFAFPLRRFVMNKVNRDIVAKRLSILMK